MKGEIVEEAESGCFGPEYKMKGICSTHRAYPQCCLGTQNLTLSRTLSRGSQETLRWAKSKLLSVSRCQKLKWGLKGSTFIRSGCKTYSRTYVIVSILLKNQNSFMWITDIQPSAFYTTVQMVVPPMAPETQAQLVLCLEGAPYIPSHNRGSSPCQSLQKAGKMHPCYFTIFRSWCRTWSYPRVWFLCWDTKFEPFQAAGELSYCFAEQSLFFIYFCTRNEQCCLVL